MAGQDAVGNVEVGLHRFVVGDALRIVTLHDATNLTGCLDGLLLNDLIVADDAEDDVGGNDREARDLVVGEELVGHFDDTFAAHFLRGVVDADGDRGVNLEES